MKNISEKIILCFFIILLLLPLVTFNFIQDKISKNENRYLENIPDLIDSKGNFSSTFFEDFSKWFKDNIGLRDEFIKLCAWTEYKIFNRSHNKEVEVGTNDWLYYTSENNIEIVKGTYPDFGENELKKICEEQIKIKNYLANQGIEYVLILTASKISIYPEYSFNGFYLPTKTPADVLADYLEENSDIKVVRIKDALLEEKNKNNKLLYYKTDSHWNEYGAKIGYLELIKKLNEWNIISSEPIELEIYENGLATGDLALMNYIDSFCYEKGCITKRNKFKSNIEVIDKKTHKCINNSVSGPTVLSYGDSMNTQLIHLLAENVPELIFIHEREISQKDIDIVKPEVICYQLGERRLNFLTTLNHSLEGF